MFCILSVCMLRCNSFSMSRSVLVVGMMFSKLLEVLVNISKTKQIASTCSRITTFQILRIFFAGREQLSHFRPEAM